MRALPAVSMLVAALLAASPAGACSRTRSATDAEIKQHVLAGYRAAASLVEVEVLADSTWTSSGTARVVRVYMGDAEVGHLYRLRGDTDSCGPGNMTKGMRGLMYVAKPEPRLFPGLLSDMGVRILRHHGFAGRPIR